MVALLLFVFGVLFGSFFNVVIYRVPRDISVVKGRSMCPNCGHTLSALELMPLVSILFLRFRCKNCRQKISARYFLIELITGLGWAGIYWLVQGDWIRAVSGIVLFSMCLIVAMIDYDTQLIADHVLLVFSLIQLAWLVVTQQDIWHALLAAGCAMAGYALIYYIAKWVYKREAFGMGDVFYMAAIGLYFTTIDALIVAIGAFFIAGLMLVGHSLLRRGISGDSEIPFGPAMSIMALVMFLWGDLLKELYVSLLF